MKILVVDDEEDMQTLFLQKFRKEIRANQVSIAYASSGESALEYLSQHHQEAVLILSDINMPGMGGLELLRHIKELYAIPPTIVMMITAYGDGESYKNAIQSGADDFLTKPIDFKLLKEKLKIKAND